MTEPKPNPFLDRLWEGWGYWIKTERGGTSQAKLAKAVAQGSGEPTRQEDVSRWLKGIGRPSYEELPSLARALGVRRDWLAFNDGPMVAQNGNAAQGGALPRRPPGQPIVSGGATKKQRGQTG